ncbi:glycosyltransferase family 4 protein [Rhodosalinus sp. FB01]|uniref:glycosyltransferase family 4 protein n=1 Tax=Rhodosalinus sp. FB01 TaxID=3239194 RepID=UPI0035253967
MSAVEEPHILRYIPHRSLSALLAPRDGAPSLLHEFCVTLGMPEPEAPLDAERYAAVLRLQGYDLPSHSFLTRTEAGDRLHAAALPRPKGEPVDVQVIGPFAKASGLGQATRLSARILEHTGLSLNCVDFGLDTPAPEGFSSASAVADYRPARGNLSHLNAESIPLVYAYGPDVFSGAYNIGYFFWELDSPALCHYLALDLLDEIWVSTEYGVSIYQPETEKPVRNVRMCYEELGEIDRAAARRFIDRRFRFRGDEFVVLVTFDSFSFVQRKNPVGVLEAFRRAFPDDPDVRLIVKTQNRDFMAYFPNEARIWKRVDAILAEDPRILLMNETLPYDQLLELKAGSDAYVSLHRSEGWGFGMIEAMNLKVPVLCTGYSGNMEFCSEETAWLVDHEEVTLAPDDYIFVRPGQKWAEPDIADAAAKLRALRDDPAAREQKAEAAFRNVRETFSAEAVAQRYGARLREILGSD